MDMSLLPLEFGCDDLLLFLLLLGLLSNGQELVVLIDVEDRTRQSTPPKREEAEPRREYSLVMIDM